MLTRPRAVLGVLLEFARLRYLVAMLAPWAFVPLLRPLPLLAVVPVLAVNLLSSDRVLFHHRTQYTAYLLPFLAVAMVGGVSALRRRWGEREVQLAVGLACLISVAMTARTVNDLIVSRWWPDARTRDVHALVAMVPPSVVVGGDERIVPHLAHRPRVYIFPQQLAECDWIIVETGPGAEYSFRGHDLHHRGRTVVLEPHDGGAPEHFAVVAERGSLLLARRPG
jgi:uncharacterized membrane protein